MGDILYQACIFDLDGTLANTLFSIADFSNRALQHFGWETIPPESYRTIVGDGVDTQLHRMLNRVLGEGKYSEADAAGLKKVYMDLYESDPMHLVSEYPGMKDTLKALKSVGIKTAVLSNKPHGWTCSIIEGLYPPGSFNLCLGQQPGLAKKPAPDGALRIASRLGVSPENCLYIGDTNTDMKTGKAAGMKTVGVLWGFRDRTELENNHAQYIVEKPDEIFQIAVHSMR